MCFLYSNGSGSSFRYFQLTSQQLRELLDVAQLRNEDQDISKIIQWRQRCTLSSNVDLKCAYDSIIRLSQNWEQLSFLDGILNRKPMKSSHIVEHLVAP